MEAQLSPLPGGYPLRLPGQTTPAEGEGWFLAVHTKAGYHLHWRCCVRTTLNLDDEALASAMEVSPGKTKTDVINEALRQYVRRQRLQGFLDYRGKMQWEGDLDELRGRKRA